MTDTVVVVANGFTRDNVRLQPWRYIFELAKHKSKSNKVFVLTEGGTDAAIDLWEEGFTVVETRLLSVKKQPKLAEYIASLKPTELWWSTTPRSIAFYFVLSKINCKKIAFITCPLYRWMELIRASLLGVPYVQTKALWNQRFIPRFLFTFFLNSKIFDSITVQSKNNLNILAKAGIKKRKLHFLPVGIDEEDVLPVDEKIHLQVSDKINKKIEDIVFLYLGALRPIRGFDSLIKAFPDVAIKNKNARLVVLARGASDKKCHAVLNELKQHNIDGRIEIIGGWLTRSEVWSYIELSDIVVLPFVLVPSDIPIAVLESLARGKPVIVSPVDGLPELAEGRGIIVDPLNTSVFADELYKLSKDKNRLEEYTQAAKIYMHSYPRWNDVGKLMDKISNNNK